MGKRGYPRCRDIWGSGRNAQRNITRSYSRYVALLCDIIDKEPSNYKEVAEKKEWKDAMIEEYQSIMKNDVWNVVPRLEGKSVVTSKWIYKIKHVVDGIIEKYKRKIRGSWLLPERRNRL